MSLERGFGELRSLMQEVPSESVWVRLVSQLSSWPRETLESEALPYVCDYLSRWPEALERRAPESWKQAVLGRGDAPQLLACATLWLQWAQVEEPQLGRLLRCPHTRNLRTINLEGIGCPVSVEHMELLANSQHLDALKTLSLEMILHRGALGVETLDVLARARGLSGLRRLSLMANDLPAETFLVLRRGELLGRLTELELAYNELGGEMTHLDGMRWESIELLDLRGCELKAGDAEALSRLDAPRLRVLILSQNRPTQAGVAALLASHTLPALVLLEVKDCELDAEAVEALVAQAARRGVWLNVYDDEAGAPYML